MKILITNDDGIFAPGITALVNALKDDHEVFVLAPDRQCSGFSHCISFDKKLTLNEVDKNRFSLNGTPCDCVKLAIDRLFQPDLVIRGINAGRTSGTDVWYSCTVQAAVEGVISGYPALAVSSRRSDTDDYSYSAEFIAQNITKLYGLCREINGVLNVNFPVFSETECKGIKAVPLGRRIYHDSYEKVSENEYFMRGDHIDDDLTYDNDLKCFEEGYITLTAITIDPTDYELTGGLTL